MVHIVYMSYSLLNSLGGYIGEYNKAYLRGILGSLDHVDVSLGPGFMV